MRPAQTTSTNLEEMNIENSQHFSYDLLQNNEGELVLIIDMQPSQPENPRLVYDGGANMILYRNQNQALTLKDISEEARKPLSQSDKMKIVEWGNEDNRLEYEVEIKQVTSLDGYLK